MAKRKARSTERYLWQWMKKATTAAQYLMQRVENYAGVGTPDAYCIRRADGRMMWLELKVSARPVRATSVLCYVVRDSQVSWFADANRARAYVLLRVGTGRLSRHYLLPPDAVAKLNGKRRPERWHKEHSVCDPFASQDEILKAGMEYRNPCQK